jgi:polyisoprenoid-binding protein YceI
MRIRIRTVLALTLVLAAASPARPGNRQAVIVLDPATTHIGYTLEGFPHTTVGTFKLKNGEIRIDPETGKTDGRIIVDAASGTSGVAMRDERMRNSILDAQLYPEISFAPRQTRGTPLPQGDFTVNVSGTFFLHGDQHDLMMDVRIHRTGDNFMASTHFIVPYVMWGLENPSVLVLKVSDKVKIDVNAAGHVSWASAP